MLKNFLERKLKVSNMEKIFWRKFEKVTRVEGVKLPERSTGK